MLNYQRVNEAFNGNFIWNDDTSVEHLEKPARMKPEVDQPQDTIHAGLDFSYREYNAFPTQDAQA